MTRREPAARPALPSLAVARLRAYRAALVGLAALTALVSGAVGGAVAFVEQSSTQAVRTAPDLVSGAASVLRLTTRVAPGTDARDAQDTEVRRVLQDATGTAPVDVVRALSTEARSATSAEGEDLDQVVLRTQPVLGGQALVDGAVDPGPGEAVVPLAAAGELGLDVGGTVEVGGVVLTVVGLWEPVDGASPAWTLDSVLLGDDPPYGPVLVDQETLLAVQDDPFVSWTVSTRPSALTTTDVATLAAGLPTVRGTVAAGPAEVRGIVETGTLASAVTALDQQARTARAVTTVPVVLLLVVSLVSVVQVARLLVVVRVRENQVLVARGASVRQLARVALLESLPAAVVGATTGGLVAWCALGLVGPTGGWSALGLPEVALTAVATALLVVVVFVTVAAADAWSLARVRAVDASGRARTAVGLSGAVLLAAVGALLGWRVWRSAGMSEPDAEALVVAAPGVLLLALVLVVLLSLAPVLRLLERRARRRPGLSPVLAARQVSRRLVAFTVPAVLVALATGAVLLASGYAGTTDHLRAQVGGLANGSDVRVQTTTTGTVSPVSTVPAVDDSGLADASSLVLDVEGTVGDISARVLGIPGDQLTPLLARTPAVDLRALSEVVTPGALPGAALPESTDEVMLSLSGQAVALELPPPDFSFPPPEPAAGGPAVPVTAVVWLADERGGALQLVSAPVDVPVLEEPGAPVEHEVAVPVPATASTWRVVALELRVDPRRGPVALDLEVTAVSTAGGGGTAPLDDGGRRWELLDEQVQQAGLAGAATPLAAPSGASLPAVSGDLLARGPQQVLRFLDPGTSGAGAEVTPRVRAVAVPELLERLEATTGDTLDVAVSGQRVQLEIVGQTHALPGGLGGPALAVDLDALQAFGLRTARAPVAADEIWLAASDPTQVVDLVDVVEVQLPRGWTVTSAATSAAVPATSIGVAFWVAAAGAVVLALAGTWSVAGALGRERRGEVVALRAVGLSARQQARSRSAELGLVLGCALVAGLVAGSAVAVAVADLLARITVPEAFAGLSSGVHLDPLPLVVLLTALLLGAVALTAVQARTVRRQALDLDHREDAR